MGTPKDYIEIMRPVNSVMLGAAIIIGAFITGGTQILGDWVSLVYAFLTGFTMSGAAMAINDYYDREIDAINEPHRAIPSGRISPRSAVVFTGFLSVIGLASSYMVSLEALLIAVFAWIVMMTYSMWGKKTGFLGNLMVSASVALPFMYGGVMTGSLAASLSFSGIAFLANTGREITKGIVDVDGDRKAGVRTIAVTSGEKNAAIIASLFFLSAVLVSIYPIYSQLVSFWYIPFVAITDLGLIYSSYQVTRDPTRETSRQVKTRILYLMLVGLIGFAAGSLL
ncbi:MAG: geranylgeranylglycerol-phosphate geranylgeranyltransferase [Candidatus Bathyarchaeia archaeon]